MPLLLVHVARVQHRVAHASPQQGQPPAGQRSAWAKRASAHAQMQTVKRERQMRCALALPRPTTLSRARRAGRRLAGVSLPRLSSSRSRPAHRLGAAPARRPAPVGVCASSAFALSDVSTCRSAAPKMQRDVRLRRIPPFPHPRSSLRVGPVSCSVYGTGPHSPPRVGGGVGGSWRSRGRLPGFACSACERLSVRAGGVHSLRQRRALAHPASHPLCWGSHHGRACGGGAGRCHRGLSGGAVSAALRCARARQAKRLFASRSCCCCWLRAGCALLRLAAAAAADCCRGGGVCVGRLLPAAIRRRGRHDRGNWCCHGTDGAAPPPRRDTKWRLPRCTSRHGTAQHGTARHGSGPLARAHS